LWRKAVVRQKTDLSQLLTSAVSSNNTKEVPTGTATRRQGRKSQNRSVLAAAGDNQRALRAIARNLIAKAALAAKKARGCTLGSPVLHLAREAAAEVVSAKADAHAAKVLPITRRLQKAGITSQRDIAKTLNDDGIKTARGGEWHSSSVGNVLKWAKD
jgi:hypothetical protein